MTKITPPAELSPRVVPRESPHVSLEDSRRTAIQSAVIRWRDLALAAWGLKADEQYTGRLPEGMSSQQFWAKATRAARAMGGEVGVAVRGRQWWVWGVRTGAVAAVKKRPVVMIVAMAEDGKVIIIPRKLTRRETREVRADAAERGWSVGVWWDVAAGETRVWRTGRAAIAVKDGKARGRDYRGVGAKKKLMQEEQ